MQENLYNKCKQLNSELSYHIKEIARLKEEIINLKNFITHLETKDEIKNVHEFYIS